MTSTDWILLGCIFLVVLTIGAVLFEALMDTDEHQDARRRNRAGDDW